MASSSSSSPEISSADPVQSFSYKDATKDEVLEDLSSRFILNLPDEELTSLERLCFQVEQAHWFYEDFIREQNNKLPSLPLKRFSEMLFRACPLLNKWSDSHEQAFNDFMQYKTRVPVCGAIMLNAAMDKCVLVKGWKASSGWGFPKGKINQTEPEVNCAIREVLEETGYNLADQINPNHVLNFSIKEQKIFLYIVPGVPEDFPFETKTRKEISKIQWFNIADLPTWKKNRSTPGKFYLISPFISGLRAFINENKPRNNTRKNAKPRKGQPVTSQLPSNSRETSAQEPVHDSNAQAYATNNIPEMSSSLQVNPTLTADSLESLDPHMSRLLSSLTLSATTTNTHQSNSTDSSREPALVQKRSTPQQSNRSSDLPAVSEPQEQLDWSSSMPTHFTSQPQASGVNTGEVSAPLLSSTGNDLPSPSLSTTVQPTVSPTSPKARRPSSTADISPYLSRATAVPTSAKRLQQISLLESIASESERSATTIAALANAVSRGPGTQFQPVPPVQPQTLPGSLPDVGVLYSSMYPAPPASAAGFHPRPPLEQPAPAGYHDPFQVRSRTSQAFHRSPAHNPTGSVNLTQNQLLANVNGSRGDSLQGPHPQFMYERLPPQHFNAAPTYYPQMNLQYAPPQQHPFMNGVSLYPSVLPQQQPQQSVLQAYPRPYPDIRPIPTPTLNMGAINPPNTASATLLSILNGRPNQQSNVPAQVRQ